MSIELPHWSLQSQTTVTSYFESKQLLLFVFVQPPIVVQSQKAVHVSAYSQASRCCIFDFAEKYSKVIS